MKEKFTGPASKDLQKDNTPTKDNARSFDVAAGIAVAVDTNTASARIGDGNADLDGKNGKVTATGDVSVKALVKARPDVSASSDAKADTGENAGKTDGKTDETKFGGSLAVALGFYNNNTYAQISDGAIVNSKANILVSAKSLNEIDPLSLWGVNLVTPFLQKADFTTDDGSNARV